MSPLETKILVVDDDPHICNILKEGLATEGRIDAVQDPIDALIRLNRERYNIVFLDLSLPKMGGADLLPWVVKHSPEIRVIIYSGMVRGKGDPLIDTLIQLGAIKVFEKPTSPEKLCNYIHSLRDPSRKVQLDSLVTNVQVFESVELGCYHRDHSISVARVASHLAAEIGGICDREFEDLIYAAKIHDIGKNSMNAKTLTKKGITPEEKEGIKKHPIVGADRLSYIPNTSEIQYLVLTHHERLDGSGYPDGISGRQIDSSARILQLSDFFMGELTPKPYLSRPPKTLKDLEKLLGEDNGRKFDKKTTKILIDYMHKRISKDFDYRDGVYVLRK